MQRYLTENARKKRPAHRYADDPGAAEWAASARRAFERYQRFFNVPNEI